MKQTKNVTLLNFCFEVMMLLQSEAMVVKKLLEDEKIMASVKQICLLSVICKVANIVW